MIHSTVSAPKGEKTKYRLAESMKECMKTTPVEEITVRQICDCLLYTSDAADE